MTTPRLARGCASLLALALLAGCASGRHAAPPTRASYGVRSDEALIVFLRESVLGWAVSSSIFDVTGPGEQLVGILGPHEKLALYAEPGRRRYMVVGENANFMDAELEAGKAYYALVRPHNGKWKSRFSLHPFKRAAAEPKLELAGASHLRWLKHCKLIDPPASAQEWAAQNAVSIHARHAGYLPQWREQDSEELRMLTLEAGDGLDAALP